MKFLEKDLEEVIFNASYQDLEERGLSCVYNRRKRQVKIGNYGIADIVCIDYENDWYFDKDINHHRIINTYVNISIIELKLESISISSFLQGLRYVKGLSNYISKRGIFEDLQINYNLVIVGKTIDLNSDLIYLPDFMGDELFLDLVTYDFDLKKGLNFKSHSGYALVNEGFKFPRQ